MTIFNIPARCLKDAFLFLTSIMSELMGVGLRKACASPTNMCISASFGSILDKGRLAGKESMLSETCPFSVLGM